MFTGRTTFTHACQPDRARVSTTTFIHKTSKRVDIVYPFNLEANESPEEVVLHLQGYLTWTDLPPIYTYQRCVALWVQLINSNTSRLPRNVTAAKQSVRLTGLGQEGFDACALAILEIQHVLSGQLPPNSLEKFHPGTEQGHLTLDFSNRYLTLTEENSDQEVPMNSYIDPVSVLRERTPSNARHLADNEVLYFEKRPTSR